MYMYGYIYRSTIYLSIYIYMYIYIYIYILVYNNTDTIHKCIGIGERPSIAERLPS